MTNRVKWLDIAKGLGIIFVVLGHSGNEIIHHYLFWFHMPLFFLISGMVHKQIHTTSEFKKMINRRSKKLLIPYISYGIVISLIILIQDKSITDFFSNLIILVIQGGQNLTGYFGVFWFVTCLYLTQIIFSIITLKFKNQKSVYLLTLFFYLVANFISYTPALSTLTVTWNTDVVLFSFVFYALGYYCKGIIKKIVLMQSVLVIVSLCGIVIILMGYKTNFEFVLDMKYSIYGYPIINIFIPIIFILLTFVISKYLSSFKYDLCNK